MDTNPIPKRTRDILYVLGIVVGILGVVAGPLMIALETPEAWVAVVVSAIGAVTSLLATLARANLSDSTPPGRHTVSNVVAYAPQSHGETHEHEMANLSKTLALDETPEIKIIDSED